MPINGLYEPENMQRVKLGQLGVVVLALAIGGYMAAGTVFSLNEVWTAQRSLGAAKTESAELSRDAAKERKAESAYHGPEAAGVDAFAVRFSQWARARAIRVDSYTPEGAPSPSEIVSQDVKLGTWNASKVRIKGHGDYWQLVSLLGEFQTTKAPVRLESFVLQSTQQVGGAGVTFDLLLTVFERVDPNTAPTPPANAAAGEATNGNASG